MTVAVVVSVVRCGGGISFSGRFGGSFAQIMSIMTIRISVSMSVISVSITMTVVSVTVSVPRCGFGFRSGFWGSGSFGSWFSIGGSLTQIMSIMMTVSVISVAISVMSITMAIISVVGISFGCYHGGKG